MRVLIITYYWPPAGGSGVQRWLKFVKYLQNFGIEPVVYTVENPQYPTEDVSLLKEIPAGVEVLKQPLKSIQNLLPKKTQKSGVANVSKGGFLSWVRGNFFIPDAKKSWVQPSVIFLSGYLKKNPVEVVVSTGPPHSMHLIANQLRKQFPVKWIADFRDPWTSLYYNQDFNLTSWAKAKNKKLETEVLQNADVVLTVSNELKKEFSSSAKRVEVITNGYDDEALVNDNFTLNPIFSLAHIGLLPKQSNPTILWEVLQEIASENKEFASDLQLNLVGNVNSETVEEIKKNGLINNTNYAGYVSHKKAIEFQKTAQVLLLLIPKTQNSKGILTGKLFEYITSKRPILAIGDEDGDLAKILQETNTGKVVGFTNKEALKVEILNLYQRYKNGSLVTDSKYIEQFHRKKLTEKLANLIKEITA